ncbi:hypothetical protein OC834_006590 [Tilletia horrida]|nr:hypothetical protein OC834_006590 [Tilletia horrida]
MITYNVIGTFWKAVRHYARVALTSIYSTPPLKKSKKMSWYSPRMSSAPSSSAAPLQQASAQSPAQAPPPATPASVPDLHPTLCRDIIQFRHFLARYRALDDRITSLLNRSLASSREAGRNLPPSLLLPLPTPHDSPLLHQHQQQQPQHQEHADAGVSTYARADPTSCAALWDQLVRVWAGREESVQYCLAVTSSARAALGDSPQSSARTAQLGSAEDELAWLDADRSGTASLSDQAGRESASASASASASGRRARKTKDRDAERAPEGWRSENEEAWRGKREAEEDALARQLHNELVVDQILRRRSIDVFRSRCPGFRPPAPSDAASQPQGSHSSSQSSQDLLARSWKYWTEK